MGGKSGKRNPDDVLLGYWDSPEAKALTTIVAELDGFNAVADLYRNAVKERAIAHGIIVNGEVTPEWKDIITVNAAAIRQSKRERSAKSLNKKG